MSRYNNSEQLQYAQHTRDYYKGKSFHIHGEWVLGQHYFNDDFITSWVTYKGALLYCKKSHISNLSTEPILEYEGSIVSGIKPNEF
jgi:hypothetical protein